MSEYYNNLADRVREHFGNRITDCHVELGELTVSVAPDHLIDVCQDLRDDATFACDTLIDCCGADYSEHGDNWQGPRFCSVYHLLSVQLNHRVRVKCFVDGEPPVLPSVINIWKAVDWFERESFDHYGIIYEGHPDLRRILTDYGFVGHPFRKDFPLSGNVEMRYDPEKQRVIYQPVSIEMRVNTPRVIRDDHRYSERLEGEPSDA
jgi:NADH-quinone oxidoreductase subunit C